MAEFVMAKGYPLEEYLVVTEDGYILTLFRIPYGRNRSLAAAVKRTVILQHGLFSTSTCYVISSPEKGLGKYLYPHQRSLIYYQKIN
ncbi:lipase, family member [Nesidiocoris tenuis]|uniref:Lipase, family member n=1 Tax=Nesidiocoris tenuis TaxID=355587 RepID=A0ABN7AAR8_9HEMI|nr:lipase, family member [Nesidiocoris tenuis]